MAAKNKAQVSEAFDVGCPCCGAVLKVDPATHGVISHVPPPTKRMFENFDAAAKGMHEQDARRESLFRQSVEAEKNKADLLEKKFRDAMEKAKGAPIEKPLRDFDLD